MRVDKHAIEAAERVREAALSPREKAERDARGTVWVSLYGAASYALVLGIGLTTGDFIYSDPETSVGASIISNAALIALFLASAAWAWRSRARWLAAVVFAWVLIEVAAKLAFMVDRGAAFNPGGLILPIVAAYAAFRGVIGSWRLRQLRSSPESI